jgi:hypothetical protein
MIFVAVPDRVAGKTRLPDAFDKKTVQGIEELLNLGAYQFAVREEFPISDPIRRRDKRDQGGLHFNRLFNRRMLDDITTHPELGSSGGSGRQSAAQFLRKEYVIRNRL